MSKKLRQDALSYHEKGRKGKIEVIPSKSHSTQRDLSLAYSPGVAEPCKEIHQNPQDVYRYTAKGNLVAVISNGTAVLGLGDIGPLASKPVMEGKGLLFKIFADIDVFDIEIDQNNPEKFIETVKAIAPTFGGINLEDIKAPEAFEIEKRLRKELDIPVMHDDQHGTAIISAAALINALEIANKKIDQVKFVVNGAGAAAVACTNLYVELGAKKENILMCDSKGVINHKRTDLNTQKKQFQVNTELDSLEDAIQNADVFIGLSKGGVLSSKMLSSMNDNPIVFAMANPIPEIDYNLAIKTRDDVIMATGRSDFPNQVNNVLGFPYIFRGALDVNATSINEEMKLAAVHALAEMAKEPVPELVLLAYNQKNLSFGKNYIIPKPFDNRLITRVSMAVAKAAMDSGIAQNPIQNWKNYEEELLDRMGGDQKLIRMLQSRAKKNPKRVAFNNADELNVLKAAQIVADEGIAIPILLGEKEKIEALKKEYSIDIDAEIIDPKLYNAVGYVKLFWDKRKRKGITLFDAEKSMSSRDYYGAMMVEAGDADAFITGYSKNYAQSLKPLIEVIGKEERVDKISGLMMQLTQKGPMFYADTAIIANPTWEDLVRIALMTSYVVKSVGLTPKIAMLSYENFSDNSEISKKVAKAVKYLHKNYSDLIVDGEVQPDFVMDTESFKKEYPFSKLAGQRPNVFIFPNLSSGNLAYKIMRGTDEVITIGPILMGMAKPAHVLQMRSNIDEIVNLTTIAVLDAQMKSDKK